MTGERQDKSKYFPERFRQLCPFATEFAKAYAQKSKEEGGAVFFHYKNLVPIVGPMAAAHYDEALDEMGLSRAEARHYDRQVSLMMTMAAWYARFAYYGKQIFELTPELAEEFLHTDVDAILAGDIVLPFPVLYLHWGARPELQLPDGSPEGAYVQEVKPGQLEVNVCLAQPDFSPSRHAWLEERGSGMSLTLVLGNTEMPIEKVIAQSMDFSKLDTAPETARADDESDRHYIERNVQLISGQREVASQILRIVANALIYIDQAGGEGRTRWPDDAPKGMLTKLEGAAKGSKQEKKLFSQLSSMGYTPVRLFGEDIGHRAPVEGAGAIGRTVAAHWRRGHWRRQAFGPGRAERKLIRIRPVWVGAGSAGRGESEAGRAYQVDTGEDERKAD
jgi:hypothetical protein